jgi:hypothetical protein
MLPKASRALPGGTPLWFLFDRLQKIGQTL